MVNLLITGRGDSKGVAATAADNGCNHGDCTDPRDGGIVDVEESAGDQLRSEGEWGCGCSPGDGDDNDRATGIMSTGFCKTECA